MAAKPHFAASVQSKKGRLYAVMQVKKDGTTKPVWRALGLPEGANKTKVNKAFREVVAQYEQEFWEEQERGGRPPADIPVYDYLVALSWETPICLGPDTRPLLVELKRMGSNVNQIAQKVNAGAFTSYNFQEVVDQLGALHEELCRLTRSSPWQR